MWSDLVLNPVPLTYESGALPTGLPGPAKNIMPFETQHSLVYRFFPLLLMLFLHIGSGGSTSSSISSDISSIHLDLSLAVLHTIEWITGLGFEPH